MGRLIGAVVAGYFVMFGVVFLLFSAAYTLMGADRAFKPGSYEPGNLWIWIMFIGGFVAALVGGWVCARISSNPQAVKWLAVLVLALGILCAIPSLMATPRKEPRPAGLSNMEAMKKAQTPTWVALSNPVIGVAGVWFGGRRRKETTPPSPM
jgi:hypothetical protein